MMAGQARRHWATNQLADKDHAHRLQSAENDPPAGLAITVMKKQIMTIQVSLTILGAIDEFLKKGK